MATKMRHLRVSECSIVGKASDFGDCRFRPKGRMTGKKYSCKMLKVSGIEVKTVWIDICPAGESNVTSFGGPRACPVDTPGAGMRRSGIGAPSARFGLRSRVRRVASAMLCFGALFLRTPTERALFVISHDVQPRSAFRHIMAPAVFVPHCTERQSFDFLHPRKARC